MHGLAGRRALVLCGTRGIGLGVARSLARYGATVTISGTDPDRAAEVARGLPGTGHTGFACDFGHPEQVGERVAATGPFDVVLLNTPGAAPGTVEALTAATLREALDLMLLSVEAVVAATLPVMRRQGWGRIVAITSSSLAAPISGLAASSVSRAAVQSYLKLLAESVGRSGVTVNHVLPGKIDTDRVRAVDEVTARTRGIEAEAVRKANEAAIPVGRYGTPDDVGELVAFLASDSAGYITGTGIRCDGGFTKSL